MVKYEGEACINDQAVHDKKNRWLETEQVSKKIRRWIICTLYFSQKLYSGDYLFVYASDDNNAVVFIQNTPDSVDTPEAEIPYEDVVDTTGDYMLDEME